MCYTWLVEMGVRGKDFFYTYKQWGRYIFRKHIYEANAFSFIFYELFFTLDTICADNKDRPMAGCKNYSLRYSLAKALG